MIRLAVTVVIIGVGLAACTVETAPPTNDPAPAPSEQKVLLSPSGVVTSNELFEVFVSTCLESYPDGNATKVAMNRAGLRTVEYYPNGGPYDSASGAFEDLDRKITSFFAPILDWSAIDGPHPFAYCEVKAEVVDLESDWTPLVDSLSKSFPNYKLYRNDRLIGATFGRDGTVFQIEVDPPALAYFSDSEDPKCKNFGCRRWTEASVSLELSK